MSVNSIVQDIHAIRSVSHFLVYVFIFIDGKYEFSSDMELLPQLHGAFIEYSCYSSCVWPLVHFSRELSLTLLPRQLSQHSLSNFSLHEDFHW